MSDMPRGHRGRVPEGFERQLPPLPRPLAEPRIDQCPNFTHYLPYGGSMQVVVCDLIPGHDIGAEATKHHGVYVLPTGEEVEFVWPLDEMAAPA